MKDNLVDNRKWNRILPEATSTSGLVRTEGGEELPCQIVDESETGLALALKSHSDLEVGRAIELVFSKVAVPAIIRNVTERGILTRIGVSLRD